ncbi:MAG: methyltransferase domain-containing protein [Alphaproteobacteria bacterium]|nr:methyltransferase domain-containing protein [Alphaproteobacteria bacterium]
MPKPVPEHPFKAEHFRRIDEGDDRAFYDFARLVAHIDEPASAALAGFYGGLLPAAGIVLDLMSSYVSHLPGETAYGEVVGLGMNGEEMAANAQLHRHIVHDLNRDPRLPFADAAFDGALLTVSIQYLVQPVQVFAEVGRVLRPGAPFAVAFSNRLFPTKAIALWRALDDRQHGGLVRQYFLAAGGFDAPAVVDLSPASGDSDPLWVVVARRRA